MTSDWAQGVLTSYLSNESPPRGERDASGGSEEEAFLRMFKLLVYIDLENLTSSVSVRDLLLNRINYKVISPRKSVSSVSHFGECKANQRYHSRCQDQKCDCNKLGLMV